jgi:hypothetical protein
MHVTDWHDKNKSIKHLVDRKLELNDNEVHQEKLSNSFIVCTNKTKTTTFYEFCFGMFGRACKIHS